MRVLLAIVEAVLSTKGVLGGCWGGPREYRDAGWVSGRIRRTG